MIAHVLTPSVSVLCSCCAPDRTFLPAFEEKLRLLSVCGRWKDLPRVISEIRSKRLSTDCSGEGIAVCSALALECFLTDYDPAKHERAVAALLQSVAREEGEGSGACTFWIWQASQLLSRLCSARTDAPSLALLSAALAPPTAAAAASKAGPNINLAYESGYISLRRGEFEPARAAFATVAAAALAVEKNEKAEEDEAAAGAAAPAAGKVNEDERLQKACAAVGVVLALLGSGAVGEAAAAFGALPAEVVQYTSAAGAPQPLPCLLYARASLAASQSDTGLAARLLAELVDAHALACVGRNPAVDDESLLPVVANLHPGLPNAVSALNRWVLAIDPWVVGQAAELMLKLVGLGDAAASSLGAVQARPVAALVAPHLDLLGSMQSSLRSVLAFQPGSFDLWQSLALLAWVAQDAAAASEAATKAEGLAGAKDPRVGQLKRVVSIAAAAPAAATAAPSALSTPSKPLASTSASAAAPNAAQQHHAQFRAMGAETGTGIDFDDDEEEDVDALFKAAADVGDEVTSPAAGRAAREAQAEREAQQHLDELESRSQSGEATRLAREAEQKRLKDEAVRRAAEAEAAAALAEASKADQRAAELRKAEEIAALRAAREAEKRRQAEEIERAEREREEQRELDRQERMRQRAAATAAAAGGVSEVTAIQSFDGGDDVAPLVALDREPERRPMPQQMKWNRPADAIVVPAAAAAPASGVSPNPASSTSPSPLLSPNGTQSPLQGSYDPSPSSSPTAAPSVSGLLQRPPSLSPSASPATTTQGYGASPSPTNTMAASSASLQQQQRNQQQSFQRSEEARLAQEKKEKIMAAGLQIDQAKKFTKTAFWGEVFLKHGRRGSPHERNVTLEVTGSELKFDWSSGQLKAHKNDIQLVEGKGTAVFQRATADRTRAERCFSIVTATRTLDLEAPSDETRDYWVMGIKLLLKYLK